jgi:hypothetical protein
VAKTALFAAGTEGRKKTPPGRSYAHEQAAKTTLFAARKLCRVSKKAPQATFFQ